jgi:hypothetical protein
VFGGWPAFYKFFFESYHWTIEDVHRCPIYLACILLGAIGDDHLNVQMTFKDTMRYYGSDPEKMRLLRLAMGGNKQRTPRQPAEPRKAPARKARTNRVRVR